MYYPTLSPTVCVCLACSSPTLGGRFLLTTRQAGFAEVFATADIDLYDAPLVVVNITAEEAANTIQMMQVTDFAS